MEEVKKVKKKLSEGAKEAIHEETKKIFKEELDFLNEQLPRIVADNYFKLKEGQRYKQLKDRIELINMILLKYLPLKRELDSTKKIFFTNTVIKENDFEFYNTITTSEYKPKVNGKEDKINYYYNLYLVWIYIDTVMKLYKEEIQEKIRIDKESYKEKKNQRTLDRINRNTKKLYILENHYKKGISATKIKLDIYNNERRYI